MKYGKSKHSGRPGDHAADIVCRAAHSQKQEHIFYDAKAIEIVKRLDYDFSKAEKDAAMGSGVIARTILPEVIDIRRRFLNGLGRISMIAKSAMDESWAAEIEDLTGKVLVVIEGLVMYLTEADVKKKAIYNDSGESTERRLTAIIVSQ